MNTSPPKPRHRRPRQPCTLNVTTLGMRILHLNTSLAIYIFVLLTTSTFSLNSVSPLSSPAARPSRKCYYPPRADGKPSLIPFPWFNTFPPCNLSTNHPTSSCQVLDSPSPKTRPANLPFNPLSIQPAAALMESASPISSATIPYSTASTAAAARIPPSAPQPVAKPARDPAHTRTGGRTCCPATSRAVLSARMVG